MDIGEETWTYDFEPDVPWTQREHEFELPNGIVCKGSELRKYWSDPLDWQMELLRRYRGVTIFRSRVQMLAQFPPVDVSGLLDRQPT